MMLRRAGKLGLYRTSYRHLSNDSWLNEIQPRAEPRPIPKESCIVKSEQSVQSLLKQPPQETQLDHNNKLVYRDLGEDEFGFNRVLVKLTDYFFGNAYQSVNAIRGEKSIKKAQRVEQRTFQDLKFIRVRSGGGGNGAISFFRDANRPTGPPDGGDGGNGGNIYLKVVDTINSLHRIRRTYVAKNGQPGKGSQLDGKKGEDILIEVPKGTTIRWIPDPFILRDKFKEIGKEKVWLEVLNDYLTNEVQLFRDSYQPGEGWMFSEHDAEYYHEKEFFLKLNDMVKQYDEEIINEEIDEDKFPILGMDLNDVTEKPILLVKGGKGGMGNMNFLTKDVRNPRFCKKGRSGLTESFLLELRLIADLGLVGLPNAGKSTLLNAISKARPRIGHWEFTTLQPTIGTIYTTIDKDPFTVADIPGIVKGASENKGMGLDFLRHIERCKGLAFVVSLENDPVRDLEILIGELGDKLANKKKMIIATKGDLNGTEERFQTFKKYVEQMNRLDEGNGPWQVLPMCATKGENVEACIKLMSQVASK